MVWPKVALLFIAIFHLANGAGLGASKEDLQLASDVAKSKTELCKDQTKDPDVERARKIVQGAVGSKNVVRDALLKAKSMDDFGGTIQDDIVEPGWIIERSWPLIIMILMIVIYLLTCWTYFPCCKCCRIHQAHRANSGLHKIVIIGIGVLLSVGPFVSGVVAYVGYQSAVEGFHYTACEASRLTDTFMSGKDDHPKFIGIVPFLGKFSEIEKVLEKDSPFMKKVGKIIDDTKQLSYALGFMSQVMKNIEDIYKELPADIKQNNHKCDFCDQMGTVINKVRVDVVDGSLAKAIDTAREEAKEKLQGQGAGDMTKNLGDSTVAVEEFKVVLRDGLKPFATTEEFDKMNAFLEGDFAPGQAFAGVILSFAILMFFGLGVIYFLLLACERSGEVQPGGYRKMNAALPCCTCCCTCFAFFVVILSLLAGGLLYFSAYIMSSGCLIADTMDGKFVRDISSVLGQDISTLNGKNTVDFLEKCILQEDEKLNPSILDVMQIKDSSDKVVSMRSQIFDSIKKPLEDAFKGTDDGSKPAKIATEPAFVTMVDAITNNNLASVIVYIGGGTDAQKYRDLAENDNIDIVPTSISCTVSDTITSPAGVSTEIKGIKTFQKQAEDEFKASSSNDCDQTLICGSGAPACLLAREFLLQKQTIRSLNNFNCVDFIDEQGQACTPDPGSAEYCMSTPGKWTTKPKQCNLKAYQELLNEFADQLKVGSDKVDELAGSFRKKISEDLKKLVEDDILNKLTLVADGFACGFMAPSYRRFVAGICFRGVSGFVTVTTGYIACGVTSLILCIYLYFLWRRFVDNLNFPEDDAKSGDQKEEPKVPNNKPTE